MNTLKFPIIAAVAVLGLSITACNSMRKTSTAVTGPVQTETLTQTEGAISHVLYGEWTAFNVGGNAVVGENRPYVIFDKSGDNPFIVTSYANNGCNTLNGQFSVTPGGKMKPAGEMISTMRMCHDAPYEMGFNLALNYVTNYTLEQVGSEYLLYMKDDTGKNLMILRKADLGFINGAWRVSSMYGREVSADKDMQIVIDVPDQKLHGNAGCNVVNGTIYIDPNVQNSVQFKNLATTRMTCPDIALEQEFLRALETVVTAVPGNNGSALLKNAQGNVVVTLTPEQLK